MENILATLVCAFVLSLALASKEHTSKEHAAMNDQQSTGSLTREAALFQDGLEFITLLNGIDRASVQLEKNMVSQQMCSRNALGVIQSLESIIGIVISVVQNWMTQAMGSVMGGGSSDNMGGFGPGGDMGGPKPNAGQGGFFPGGPGGNPGNPGGLGQGGNPGGLGQGGYPGGYSQGGYPGGYSQGGYPGVYSQGGFSQGGYPGGYSQGGYSGGFSQGGYQPMPQYRYGYSSKAERRGYSSVWKLRQMKKKVANMKQKCLENI